MKMKDYLAAGARERATELEIARMRKALDGAPPPARARALDTSEALVSEMRAMRGEVASLRDLLAGQAPANDEILTRKQTADLLHVCIESISRLVRDEGLPCRKLGKDYRFLRSQVLAWFAERHERRSEED
jgi:excisionase family DNA binding protein